MAYQDPIIGVSEMLDSLVANDRSRHEAARELESALEARAIVLAYKNGHVFDDVDLAPVIDFIRDFPSGRISLQTETTALRLVDGGAGALRLQFELACGLVEEPPPLCLTAEPPLSKRAAAKRAIDACYPEGVPDTVLNAVLCRAASQWLKQHMSHMPDISDDTIERAAGRK
jgi:hypothetical protein